MDKLAVVTDASIQDGLDVLARARRDGHLRRPFPAPAWRYDAAGRRELICAIVIGPGDRDRAAMRAAGVEPPTPSVVRAMIDTGYNSTLIVSESMLRQLGATPTGRRATVHGSFAEEADVYDLDVVIPYTSGGGLQARNTPVVSVNLSFDSATRPYDVVIGMSIISRCRLLIDGTAGEFRLERGQRA